MLASTRSANLRAILTDDDEIRETVLGMVTAMDTIDREEVRGFRLASQLDPDLPEFMANTNPKVLRFEARPYDLLCEFISRTHPSQPLHLPNEAHSVEEIALRGVRYATVRSSKYRNSRILFRDPSIDTSNNLQAGVIQDIFEYAYRCADEEKKSFYLTALGYVRYDHLLDPYPKFGFSGGFLCQAEPSQLHILELSQVVSHFGLTKMTGKYTGHIHVMPLDRVGIELLSCCLPLNLQIQLMLSFRHDENKVGGVDDED